MRQLRGTNLGWTDLRVTVAILVRITTGPSFFFFQQQSWFSFGNSPFHHSRSKWVQMQWLKELWRELPKKRLSFKPNSNWSYCSHLTITWRLRIKDKHNVPETESQKLSLKLSSTQDHFLGSWTIKFLFFFPILVQFELHFSITCNWKRTTMTKSNKKGRRSQT